MIGTRGSVMFNFLAMFKLMHVPIKIGMYEFLPFMQYAVDPC
jgi:hypothetical protein